MNALVDSVRPGFRRGRRGLLLLGPALVAAAAYVDPGNVATNTVAGARYGYVLLWVVVVANLMAGLVQYLSAKLGLVTGRSLPEVLHDRIGRPGRLAYWAQAELVAMATDLAEVVGGAIALRLLFGLPLLVGGLITVVVSMLVLGTQRADQQQRFERIVAAMLLVVAVGFVAGLFVQPPSASAAAAGLLPRFDGANSVVLAAGMLGATVMPHAIYAHSALARDRHGEVVARSGLGRLLAITKADVSVALVIAGAVNLGLVMLGAVGLPHGLASTTIDQVHDALGTRLGPTTALLFAIALLFSGLASTSVGCYAGSVVMTGLLDVSIPLLARRAVTAIPAVFVLLLGLDPTRVLIFSQVVLSFGIPFAVIPLAVLTSRRSVMGEQANGAVVRALVGAAAVAIVALNIGLVVLTIAGRA